MSSWSNSPQAPAPYPGQGWYRITGPAKALRVLLIIVMVALGLLIVAYAVRQGVQNSYDDGRSDLSSLDNADGFVGFAASLTGGLTIAIFVLTVVWQWRLAKNHERLGRPGHHLRARLGDRWLVHPHRQLHPAVPAVPRALEGLGPGRARATPTTGATARSARSCGSGGASSSPPTSSSSPTSYQIVVGTVTTIDTKSTGGSIAASACRIAAAAFFIVVIKRLTDRQEAAIAAASAATPATAAWGALVGRRRERARAAPGGPHRGLEARPDRPGRRTATGTACGGRSTRRSTAGRSPARSSEASGSPQRTTGARRPRRADAATMSSGSSTRSRSSPAPSVLPRLSLRSERGPPPPSASWSTNFRAHTFGASNRSTSPRTRSPKWARTRSTVTASRSAS